MPGWMWFPLGLVAGVVLLGWWIKSLFKDP